MSFEFEPAVEDLLEKRYYLDGENWKGLCRRVARTIAAVERTPELREYWERRFFDIIYNREFLPNSPVLFGAGRQRHTLSACFVLPIADNLESIMNCLTRTVNIFKSGGGVGINFSKLRPKGTKISAGGSSSGPVEFLHLWDAAGEVIKQGGRRRSAQMSILHCGHPDIEVFIDAKKDTGKLQNMNLSVACTDAFMKAVSDNKDWKLIYHNSVKTVRAREIFDKMARRAWESGEPGIVFLDRINRDNACKKTAKIKATNPCAEQPLRPNESCTLGSINLSIFQKPEDFEKLPKLVQAAVRFLDNCIDANFFPDAEIDNATKKTRPIGLGIMGFADYLILNGVRYGSEGCYRLLKDILSIISEVARGYSQALGEKKGSFPAFRKSKFHGEVDHLRNSQLLSIAPTGSISKIAGCSSGIEPIFTFQDETRTTAEGIDLKIKSKWANWPNKEVLVAAHDIDYEEHIRVVAVAQKYVDTGISKTINLPENATVQDVKNAFLIAWKKQCKGITVFRKNCLREALVREVEYCSVCGTETKREGRCITCPKCGLSACAATLEKF